MLEKLAGGKVIALGVVDLTGTEFASAEREVYPDVVVHRLTDFSAAGISLKEKEVQHVLVGFTPPLEYVSRRISTGEPIAGVIQQWQDSAEHILDFAASYPHSTTLVQGSLDADSLVNLLTGSSPCSIDAPEGSESPVRKVDRLAAIQLLSLQTSRDLLFRLDELTDAGVESVTTTSLVNAALLETRTLEQDLDQLRHQLDEGQKALSDQAQDLAELHNHNYSTLAELLRTQQLLDGEYKDSKEMKSKLTWLRTAKAKHEEQISGLTDSNARLKKELDLARDQLKQNKKKIDWLRKTVDELRDTEKLSVAEDAALPAGIDQQPGELGGADGTRTSYETRIVELEAENERLNSKHITETKQFERALKKKQARIDRIERSRFWRWTRWLRRLVGSTL